MKSSGPSPKILILCYGNPLRGDDGAGLAVAKELEKIISPDLASILYRHQLVPELAEPLSQADIAFFVDAREGGVPGDIRTESVKQQPRSPDSSTHFFNPPVLLSYAFSVYGRIPRRCDLFTICGKSFEYGTEVSPVVRKSVTRLSSILSQKVSESREKLYA